MFSFTKSFGRRHRFLDAIALSSDLAAGPSPDKPDLEYLRQRGFRSLVSLNAEGAPGELLSPNVEASWAHAEDLAHARVTLYEFPTAADVDLFLETYEALPKPVYVHSLDGSSALTLAWIAVSVTGGAIHERFEQSLIPLLGDAWRRFALSEIERRSMRRAS